MLCVCVTLLYLMLDCDCVYTLGGLAVGFDCILVVIVVWVLDVLVAYLVAG